MKGKTILECVVGSTAHGTAVDDGLEDLDLMAIVLEDPEHFVGFSPVDVEVTRTKPVGVRSEAGDVDHVAYGLRKFLGLALKGNPTILLALFAPEPRVLTSEGEILRWMAPLIVSKQCYQPFRGYMRQQHERLLGLRGQRNVTRPELVAAHGYDTKYGGHVVRLGLQGAEVLSTGKISLPMRDADRELVLKVRSGGFSLAEVSNVIIAAEEALVKAYGQSTLRAEPDRHAVQRWMIATYMTHWMSK